MKATTRFSKFGARGRFASVQWIAIMVAAVLAVAGLTSSTAQAQSTIHVPDDHATIQAAIDAANPAGGDEIVVAPGTYNEAINFNGKAVHLRSSDGPQVTIIDATGLDTSVVSCVSGEGPGTVLEGFTITGGMGTIFFGYERRGGGMYNGSNSSPTVTNCTFEGNSATLGGGMHNDDNNPTVTNCVFQGNAASSNGGGMYNDYLGSPTVINCTFQNNSAALEGGGMYNSHSSPMVTNCTFENNSADLGGGVYNITSSPIVTNCTFQNNSAFEEGGGMYNRGSSPTITGCVFENNSASFFGGGMNNWFSSPTVMDCTFSGNSAPRGGGMFNAVSSSIVTNCTLQNNFASFFGGGMFNIVSSPIVTNCIFLNNSADFSGGGMFNSSSSPTVTDCVFRNNTAGAGGGIWSDSLDTVVGDTLFCENLPDNISGLWTDNGGNEFRVDCAVAGAPPVAVCIAYAFDGDPSEGGSDITLQCDSHHGRMVTLDATGSYHPDNHELTYQWELSDWDVVLDDPDSRIATGMFPLGVTKATLTVTDEFGAFSTCDVIVRVEDIIPPQVMVTSNAAVLWPPNHTMRPVQVIVTATDECFEPGFVFPLDVTVRSSEPDSDGDSNGEDGHTAPANITSAFEWDEDLDAWVAIIYLRAERAGSGRGRSYTIDAVAYDGIGNPGFSSCVIVVPKGMGNAGGN